MVSADGEILALWGKNKKPAANRGTWMHLQCELWLYRDEAGSSSLEMVPFLRYAGERFVPWSASVGFALMRASVTSANFEYRGSVRQNRSGFIVQAL